MPKIPSSCNAQPTTDVWEAVLEQKAYCGKADFGQFSLATAPVLRQPPSYANLRLLHSSDSTHGHDTYYRCIGRRDGQSPASARKLAAAEL